MFTRIRVLTTVLTALAAAAIAVPATSTTESVSEVKPGPELPSLASLNLTSADLYAIGPLPSLSSRDLTKRSADDTAVCQTSSTAAVNDVIACYNYLVSIDNNDCIVQGGNVEFCVAGTAVVGGSNGVPGGWTTSSSCYDVALAVKGIINQCLNVIGGVGGSDVAYGNGNLIVTVESSGD